MSQELMAWLEKVMDLVQGRCGLSMLEASDFNWNDLFHLGFTPEEAVNAYEEEVHG
jgi:hypothetical protein